MSPDKDRPCRRPWSATLFRIGGGVQSETTLLADVMTRNPQTIGPNKRLKGGHDTKVDFAMFLAHDNGRPSG